VSSPGGNWKNVPLRTQERVDNDSLGTIFGEGGGSLLVAVLANPNASPTAGINALAVEASSVETGSLFVESSLGGSLGSGADSFGVQDDSSGVLPESSLLDQGLPDIVNPHPGSHANTAFFIGNLMPVSYNYLVINILYFELDLDNGHISKALFDLEYNRNHLMYGTANTSMSGWGGSGSVDPSTLQFSIGSFSGDAGYRDWHEASNALSAYGTFGSGTTIFGSFAGPASYGQSASGILTFDYVVDASSPSIIDMPGSISFSGMLEHNPLVAVTGTFDIPNLSTQYESRYDFIINLNSGAITGVDLSLDYVDTSSNLINLKLYDGSGSVDSSGGFTFSAARGYVDGSYSYSTPSGTMAGSFAEHVPVPGVQVSGGVLNINAGPSPAFIPTSYSIHDGHVDGAQ
jgi:hypothetical protein